MKYSVIFYSTFITFLGFYVRDSSQLSASRCSLPKLPNGRVRQKALGRMVKFNCYTPFTLVGSKTATCIRGKWNAPLPICVNEECGPIVKPDNALSVSTYNGAVYLFFCNSGYERQGSPSIYCDGSKWNDTVPTCKKNVLSNPPTSCDFESPDLCLWEQDPLHDFDWERHSFDTPSWHIGTGPSHDHTLGPGSNGHYLYIEANDKLENSTARIMSPLYSSNLTDAGCFSFWYHMYGDTIGTLNVYFKPEGESSRKLMFTKSGNQGNRWWHDVFELPKANTNFQLIVEGVRGTGYLSDIAVDDVAILQGQDCVPDPKATTELIASDNYDQVEIVNGMQSCSGRCTYSNTTENSSNLCECGLYCLENQNCCPDYAAYCIYGNDTTDSFVDYSEVTTQPSMKTKSPSTAPNRVPIPINPKDDIDPYPPKVPNNPSVQVFTTLLPRVENKTPKAEVPPRNPMKSSTVPTVAKITTNGDDFDDQIDTRMRTEKAHSTSSRSPSKVTLPGIIAIVVGAIVGVAGTGLIVFLILQKRNSYKHKSGTSALSDDSDVRFLTSDEMLDFNLAKPEDMEM